MVVVPLIITVEDYLSMIDGFKFKPFHLNTLNIAVQSFDIGIIPRSGLLGKLLVDTFLLQKLPHYLCYELVIHYHCEA